MKQGTLATRIVMLVLFVGVAVYMGVYAVKYLSNPFSTSLAYADTLDDKAEVAGVLVRSETVLPAGAAIMDVLPEEGERVSAGQVVAVLYEDGDALERRNRLEELELEREQLQYALAGGGDLQDAAKLESQIVTSLLRLRGVTASGDLSGLDSESAALRTRVLQREFAYSEAEGSAAAIQTAAAELDREIEALQIQLDNNTTAVSAPCAGLFSGQVDGYETALVPDLLETITARQLNDLAEEEPGAQEGGVGKIVTGLRWYFACVLDENAAARLQVGDTVTVAFSKDFSGEIEMRVERVDEAGEDGCVAVFSSARNLKDVTLLRKQTVDIIFQRYEGIRIPKQALRMTKTELDPVTEERKSTQVTGVYVVVGAAAEFKEVDIVREGSDFYLVASPEDAGKKRLRAGDEVIVSATDLWDGKVVLE